MPGPDAIECTPRCYKVLGRAARIAADMHSSDVRAEHLLLAIIRERQALPTQVMARMVDLARLDAAISAAAATSLPPVTAERNPTSGGAGRRRAAEVARALGHDYIGVEHLFLAIARDREAPPTRVLARLVDCDRVTATLAELMQGPRMTYGTPQTLGDDVVFLPSGVELDGRLRRAIFENLPDGASFRFNWEYGHPWVQVVGPGDTANVLIAALKRLGWPRR
jgi:Clp amino terminal domain, pathogenicity island component